MFQGRRQVRFGGLEAREKWPWAVAGLSVAVCGQVVFGVMGSVASLTGSTCVLVIVLDAAQDS